MTNCSEMFIRIDRKITYASASYSIPLMYEAHGMVGAAYELQAISTDEMLNLEHRICYDHLNCAPWRRKAERGGER